MSETRKLAVMRNVGFGVRDTNHAMLWFTADTMDNRASLQCLDAVEAVALIEKLGITDVKYFEGRHCWVEENGNTVKVVEYCEK